MKFKRRTLPQLNFVINRKFIMKDNKVNIIMHNRDIPEEPLYIDISSEAEKELDILEDELYEQFLLDIFAASNMVCSFDVEVFTIDKDVTVRFKELRPKWRPINE